MSAIKVSVIIPCYNQGHFLAEAVNSVLKQKINDIEIVVVDDGSTDETARVANEFGDKIKYIYKCNGGLAQARNTGILHTAGELLLFLDSDDYLMPDMLEHMLIAATHAPDVTVYYGIHRWVDVNGEVIPGHPTPPAFEDALHELQTYNPFPVHSILVRRDILAKVGIFDPFMKSCEDWDLWLRIAGSGGKFLHVPHAEVAYRRHANTLSTKSVVMLQTAIAVLNKSRIFHSQCKQCQASVLKGIRGQSEMRFDEWFNYNFSITENRKNKVGLIVETMYTNPTFLVPFLKLLKRKVARKIVRQHA